MKDNINLDEIKAARAEYQRGWRKKNPEKVRKINENYWRNRIKRELAAQAEQEAMHDR